MYRVIKIDMKKSIYCLIFLYCIFLNSCSIFKNAEVEYLEKISGVEFPADIVIYETFDNMEFLLGGVFGLSKENCSYFKSKLNFTRMVLDSSGPIRDSFYSFADYYLKDSLNKFSPKSSMIIWEDCRKGNQVTFCIDTINLKMWCASWYPDNSGDFPCEEKKE